MTILGRKTTIVIHSTMKTAAMICTILYYAKELDREATEIDEDDYDRLFGESDNEEFDGF